MKQILVIQKKIIKKLEFIGGLNHGLEGEGDDDGTDYSSVDKEIHLVHPKMIGAHAKEIIHLCLWLCAPSA